ncbi:transcriptional regulator GcvA [Piscinibacter sp. XHJ-5]|uniref:transcriptional regulator GcvA n=1 Tax=Piscinibacter sp. XHJ-5 TaxID=3037797 RepID=UPI002452DFD2|nr:transcriptional regulator GcvA [Piscinibacter sp. XHJ-5]
MSRALPPLNALRAFEAAARHRNFARAAHELHVTPGALSHQIRGLERLLGVALFERRARGVLLTSAGRTLHPGLLSAFALIRESVEALRASASSGVLVVSTPPGFTSKWLAPRLHRFAQAHPEVELRIASSAAYANFAADGIDAAVRNVPEETGIAPALDSEKLIDDRLVVVGSPELVARMGRSRRDVRQTPLIHDDQLAGRPEVPTWSDWFRVAGVPPVDVRRGLRFSSAEHAIGAAIQGAGLLLTHTLLAHDELASGRLVAPLDVVVPTGRAYFLVHPKARRPRPALEAFRHWLRTEMAAM